MASEIFNACLGPPGWSRRRCICRRRRRRWALRPPSSTSWDSRTRSPWADQGGRFRGWPQPSWVLRCWWVRSRREDWDALKPESVRKRSFFEWRPVRSQEMTNFFETSRKINDRQRPLKNQDQLVSRVTSCENKKQPNAYQSSPIRRPKDICYLLLVTWAVRVVQLNMIAGWQKCPIFRLVTFKRNLSKYFFCRKLQQI